MKNPAGILQWLKPYEDTAVVKTRRSICISVPCGPSDLERRVQPSTYVQWQRRLSLPCHRCGGGLLQQQEGEE